jgi:hypothetical protein
MKSYVRVISGRTRQNLDVTGRVFTLLQQPKKDKDGTYIVVDGSSHADMRNGRSRVYLTNGVESYEPASEIDATRIDPIAAVDEKSDDEIRQEIDETFEILRDMTTAIAAGVVKGLVVSGPAGVGKSHTVEQTLREELDVMAKMRGQVSMFECFHGAMSASVLYEKLWKFKDPCNVLVFDDCDGVLYDEDALNILKAALDSKAVRQIHWNTNSYILDRKDIPNSFEYRGSIVFITNVDFTQVRSPRIQNHLEAIVSRCHYMNLGIRTVREKMIHIRNVVDKTDMLKGHGFGPEETNEIMDYVISNADRLREVSLRSCLKVAGLRRAMPDRWRRFADKNVLKAA